MIATMIATGVAIGLAADHAGAQVSCANPDDLCMGDPCVTAVIEVQSPCIVDFSPRTLIIGGKLGVPNDGVVQFTAGAIEVNATINGKHVRAGDGDGADITLIAAGNIAIRRRIDVSGRDSNGTIVLDAAGNIDLRHRLRARAKGAATATGGIVTVSADGAVTSTRRGAVDIRGKKLTTSAGQVSVSGANGVVLVGKIDARGSSGGTVIIAASSGNVTIEKEIDTEGDVGDGGDITLTAGADLALTDDGDLDASGVSAGGAIVLSGDAISAARNIYANGGSGGSLQVTAGASANLGKLVFRGKVNGGTIQVNAGGAVVAARLIVPGRSNGGGSIAINAAGDIDIGEFDASGEVTGGQAQFSSTSGNVMVLDDADVSASAGTGGEMRFSAGGNLTLGDSFADDFRATGPSGGVIEGQATGDLTADGDFRAAIGGCIGLSAGGTLDTSAAVFDIPPVGSCP